MLGNILGTRAGKSHAARPVRGGPPQIQRRAECCAENSPTPSERTIGLRRPWNDGKGLRQGRGIRNERTSLSWTGLIDVLRSLRYIPIAKR